MGLQPALVLAVNGAFLLVDLIFFAANSMKVFEGGWFPLLIAAAIAFLMLTWRRGKRISERGAQNCGRARTTFWPTSPHTRRCGFPGTAAFLSSATRGIPLTLTHHLRHIYALHERVLLVTVMTSEEPRVTDEARVHIHELCAGLTRVILHFGFAESPSVPQGVRYAQEQAELRCGKLPESPITSAGKR